MDRYDAYPPEVAAYLRGGVKRAVSVKAVRPYVIVVKFDDGIVKAYDMGEELSGVLANLKDYEVFRRVYLDDTNSIAWDTKAGHIDTSKDTVYIYGEQIN